jgi:hypothetical protein
MKRKMFSLVAALACGAGLLGGCASNKATQCSAVYGKPACTTHGANCGNCSKRPEKEKVYVDRPVPAVSTCTAQVPGSPLKTLVVKDTVRHATEASREICIDGKTIVVQAPTTVWGDPCTTSVTVSGSTQGGTSTTTTTATPGGNCDNPATPAAATSPAASPTAPPAPPTPPTK